MVEKQSSILVLNVRSERKDSMILTISVGMLREVSLYRRLSCQTFSKAFSTSINNEAVWMSLF